MPVRWPLPFGETFVARRVDLSQADQRRARIPGGVLREVGRLDSSVLVRIHDELLGVRRARPPTPDDVSTARRALGRALRDGTIVEIRPLRRLRGDERISLDDSVAEPPAASIPDEEPTTWFQFRVLDEALDPVDGVDVVFHSGSTTKKVKTNGAGIARLDGVTSSFASVRLANIAAVREKLVPRWESFTEIPPPPSPAEDTAVEALRDDLPAQQLDARSPKTLVLVRRVIRARLVGMFFETNKSFLLPAAMHGIRGIVDVYHRNPTAKLLDVGHADTVGDDAYNLDLSLERADAVAAYLANDVDAWSVWFDDTKPFQKRWGLREEQMMLSAVPEDEEPFFSGKPTGVLEEKTRKAVSDFQVWSNAQRGTTLVVDGIPGTATRREIIAAYMELQGTTLPDGIDLVTHGCGKFFPDDATADGVADPDNRRVEIFYFDSVITPPPPGKFSARGSTEYPEWKKQVVETIDFRLSGTESLAGTARFHEKLVVRAVDGEADPNPAIDDDELAKSGRTLDTSGA